MSWSQLHKGFIVPSKLFECMFFEVAQIKLMVWFFREILNISQHIEFCGALCGENVVSKEKKIVSSVKVPRLEFLSLPSADQLPLNFYKLPWIEQNITKLDWKSTMYSVVKSLEIFIFILLCLIFSRFLILFIYVINIGQ